MKDKNIRLEASGDFPFTFFIEKAVPLEADGKLIVEGIASTLNVDHDNERMAKDALHAMARVINEKGVPLRMEHSKANEAVLGDVYKAWVDERNQLWIRAAIDPAHDTGATVHSDMKIGKKYGLSVGGRVKNAVRELVESTGNYVKTFYDVILDEVSVTRRPANYDSWLFAKSFKGKEADVSPYYGSALYNQFLFENPKYDYIDQFAKSVPAEAWKKVDKSLKDINKNDTMKEEEKKKKMKKADEDAHDQDGPDKDKEKDVGDKAEKSYVSKSDFNKAMDMVAKGFKGLAGLIKGGIDNDAMDTTNPDKKKEEVIGDKGDMKKGEREGQEDEDGNGSDEDGEREKSEKDEEEEKEKSADDEKDGEEKEKSADDEEEKEKSEDKDGEEKEKSEDDEDEKKEKAEKDDEKEDYSMKSMSDAVNHIASLNKKMTGQKVAKSAKKEVADSEGSIDEFAVEIAKSIDILNDKFEKNGMRVPGLRDKMLDIIKNDAGIQEEITKMMKQPGFKKSVSMGVPYMRDKDGRMFALTAKPIGVTEEVKKSMEGKSFKEVFKTRFSSYAQENGDNQ